MTNTTPEQVTPDPPSLLVTPQEAAKMLHVHVATLTRMAAKGEVEIVRVGSLRRFRRADVQAIVDGER
jgi:excisionase family DNA binding protein